MYFFKKHLFVLFVKFNDYVGRLFYHKQKRIFSYPKKIFISEIGHIGDLIFSTPIFRIIKNNFPHSQLCVLVNPAARPILEENPYIDKIITYDHFRLSRAGHFLFKKIYRTIRDYRCLINYLRASSFDLGLDLRHFYPTTIHLMVDGGVNFVAGFGNRGHSYLLDQQLNLCPDMHEVEQKVNTLAQLGLKVPSRESIALELFVDEGSVKKIRDLLFSKGVKSDETVCVIHPGCGQQARLWFNERWAGVADFLMKRSIRIIFAGGVNEKPLIEDIKNILGPEKRFLDVSGMLSLKELAVLIKTVDFFIGLESAPSHIAAAVGTPVISLYSGTTRTSQWKPWGNRVFVITKDLACAPCYNPLGCRSMSCLRDIKVEDVIEVIRKGIFPELKKSREDA